MAMTFKSTNLKFTLCIGFSFLFACSLSARATTLSDYQRRLREAADTLERMQPASENQPQPIQTAEATITHVREELPPKELVVISGTSVTVDNAWLHEALNEYEKNKSSEPQRRELLARIVERLRALSERLAEAQNGKATTNKDDNKARMAEILRRSEYNQKAEAGNALERSWRRFLHWLASLFPRTKPLKPGTGRALSGIAQIVVIAVSLAGIGFLIWRFLPRYLRNRGKKREEREARIVLGERLEPDQTAADLLAQAESLARNGDLRGAIRKAYIALLCELGDRKIISLAQHKTNRDYLGAVRSRPSLFNSMRSLTNSFEAHWYGFVPATPDDWSEFRAGFQKAVTSDK